FKGTTLPHQTQRRGRRVLQHIAMILSEVPDVGFVAPFHLAGGRCNLAGEDLEQRALANAVGANDGHALAAPDTGVDARKHGGFTVAVTYVSKMNDVATTRSPLLERKQRRAPARRREHL